MPQAIRFDSQGRIVIEDEELGRQIIEWMQLGKDVALRIPLASGDAPDPALVSGAAITVIPRPIPPPIPMLHGCANAMCDCPIFKIQRPDIGLTETMS